jgi:hypothetical protein
MENRVADNTINPGDLDPGQGTRDDYYRADVRRFRGSSRFRYPASDLAESREHIQSRGFDDDDPRVQRVDPSLKPVNEREKRLGVSCTKT